MSDGPSIPEREARVAGLCARCQHAHTRVSARGSRFWQCARASRDPSLPRYPRLPVRDCHGFDELASR